MTLQCYMTAPLDDAFVQACRAKPIPHEFGRMGYAWLKIQGVLTLWDAFEPLPSHWLDTNLTSSDVLHPMGFYSVPNVELADGLGETFTLKQFIKDFLAVLSEPETREAKELFELRKGLWRHALSMALNSPLVTLMRKVNDLRRQGLTIEVLALTERHCGPSPSFTPRFHGAFYRPYSTVEPLLSRLLVGHPCQERHPVSKPFTIDEIPVLFEDEELIVIDKPAGLSSVPGVMENHSAKTLLETQYGALHVVHRLDVDTSGVLVFAKNATSLRHLHSAFRSRHAQKIYRAVLSERPLQAQGIYLPLSAWGLDRPFQAVFKDGKPAHTEVMGVQTHSLGPLVTLAPHTGRTHQLRVHCAHPLGLNAPILGDVFYSESARLADGREGYPKRLYLHAETLTLKHPVSHELVSWTAPLPF